MQIKITNGEVKIKEFCSRKTRKAIENALYSEVDVKMENSDGKASIGGIKMEAMERANDVGLLEMVEEITINGESVPVTIEAFDEMRADDVDKIIAEINKITRRTVPNEQRTPSTNS